MREKMVHIKGASTNQILEVMEGWNKQLQHTSLGQIDAPDTLESKDSRVLRSHYPVTARRRRTA